MNRSTFFSYPEFLFGSCSRLATSLVLSTILFPVAGRADDVCDWDELDCGVATVEPETGKLDFLAASIGDSITAAFDARRPLANREINWSTGMRSEKLVFSHALRLQETMPDLKVGTKNFAISGSKSPNVVKQAEKLAKHRPDYATVLVGANDVCAWDQDHHEQLKSYANDIRTILSTLVASNSEIKIVVSAIPNMPLLRDIGARNGCQKVWSRFKICPALLGADRTESDRLGFTARWQDANRILEQVSSEFPDHVRFASSVAEPVFGIEHVSAIDCFHPNTRGQDFLAEITWQQGWY